MKPKNFQHSSHTIALRKGSIFAKKIQIFCYKDGNISKIIWVLVLKGIFPKTAYVCVVCVCVCVCVCACVRACLYTKYPVLE